MNEKQAEAKERAPERIWIDDSGEDSSFWNDNGDALGTIEYVRADLLQQPASSERCDVSVDGKHRIDAYCKDCGQQFSSKCVYPATGTPDYRDQNQEALIRFRTLRPNWDSYNGLPINIRGIEIAQRLIPVLPEWQIVPCSDGSIQFDGPNGDEIRIDVDSTSAGTPSDLISRDAAMRAMCYMCANPERYRPAEAIEGSERLFHFQVADNWNIGQCGAQAIRGIPSVVTGADEGEQRDVCWHCKVVLSHVPKPRCEDCPDECDVEGCDADGCAPAASPAPVVEGSQLCGICVAAGRIYCPPEHNEPSTVSTSEAASQAAQEIVDIAYRDRGQVPHRDTIAAIVSAHLPDAGEVERLRGWVDGLQATLLQWSKEMVKLRTERDDARASTIREAVEKVWSLKDGGTVDMATGVLLSDADGCWFTQSEIAAALQSLLDQKEGEDAESPS